MDWLLIATGFTGALTGVWVFRLLWNALRTPPSLHVQIRPGGSWPETLLQELRGARREVIVIAPLLAHRVVAQALVDVRLRRRANIEVLLGYEAERHPNSDLAFLLEQGIQPRVDPEHDPRTVVFIIDRRAVLTGNWQPTTALGGEETLLVIKAHAEVATQYVQNYLAHKAHSRPAEVWPESRGTGVPPVASPERVPGVESHGTGVPPVASSERVAAVEALRNPGAPLPSVEAPTPATRAEAPVPVPVPEPVPVRVEAPTPETRTEPPPAAPAPPPFRFTPLPPAPPPLVPSTPPIEPEADDFVPMTRLGAASPLAPIQPEESYPLPQEPEESYPLPREPEVNYQTPEQPEESHPLPQEPQEPEESYPLPPEEEADEMDDAFLSERTNQILAALRESARVPRENADAPADGV